MKLTMTEHDALALMRSLLEKVAAVEPANHGPWTAERTELDTYVLHTDTPGRPSTTVGTVRLRQDARVATLAPITPLLAGMLLDVLALTENGEPVRPELLAGTILGRWPR